MSFAPAAATALRIIKKNGVACVWRSTTPVVDTAQKWKEQTAIVNEYSTYVALLPFDSVGRRVFGYGFESTIPQGTMLGYLPGSTEFSPALRDTVVVGEKTYVVASFDVLNPNADIDIVYVVELRQ